MSVTETKLERTRVNYDVVYQWCVTAGFEPDESAERFTDAFVVTGEDWGGGDVAGRRLRAYRQQEALAYVSHLMADEAFAWVRLDYRSYESPWTEGGSLDVDG